MAGSNPTKVTAHQTEASHAITDHYEVAIGNVNGGGPESTPFVRAKSVEYADGVLTAHLPDDMFEVEGGANGDYPIGLRAVNAGGPGTARWSPRVPICFEPTISDDVQAE